MPTNIFKSTIILIFNPGFIHALILSSQEVKRWEHFFVKIRAVRRALKCKEYWYLFKKRWNKEKIQTVWEESHEYNKYFLLICDNNQE